ncbi:MAG TPA: glycosyltransferase, partial [Bacteroidales bacterium]|nr:glycosyltransferase [Bacteroidales bacterium]
MNLSVIIVNYRSWKHLESCLNSLAPLSNDSKHVEIIVVDNASDDGRLPDFQKSFPLVNFISNSENKGFSSANNLGTSNSKGEFLLFLNPDIIANSEAIFGMMETLKQNPDIMLLTCRQQNKAGKEENPYN